MINKEHKSGNRLLPRLGGTPT